jgi:hypothetical protein
MKTVYYSVQKLSGLAVSQTGEKNPHHFKIGMADGLGYTGYLYGYPRVGGCHGLNGSKELLPV